MWGKQKPPLGSRIDTGHPLAQGLVACWLFNEGGGTLVRDITGNGNDATPDTGTPTWTPTTEGIAVDLDSFGYFVVDASAALLGLCATESFSLVAINQGGTPDGNSTFLGFNGSLAWYLNDSSPASGGMRVWAEKTQ